MVILCLVPHLSHSIDLNVHQNDFRILLQLNDELQFLHFFKINPLKFFMLMLKTLLYNSILTFIFQLIFSILIN